MEKRLLMLLLSFMLLTGCSSPARNDAVFSDVSIPGAEDRLVVFTSHRKEVWWPVIREFEEETGIWVDVTTTIFSLS